MPACEPSERDASINVTRHEIQVGSQTVYYQVVGQGEPIILVHGLSGSSRWWVRNIPALAEHYRLYLIDLPGFGTMRRYRGRLALDEIASGIVLWMEAVGIKQAHLVGHSMGGIFASGLQLITLNAYNAWCWSHRQAYPTY